MENEADEQLPLNSNLKCNVCGENKFIEREGFYYCQECGTKQEQVRLVEIERDEEFDQQKLKTRKQKVHAIKADKPQLTSWECYNYILRGFVEDLISFGAKEELKLMTLQVWAAYLRRMEVAFFNRKPDLPKLGVKYFHNDAEVVYNHSKKDRKKRQRRRSDDNSFTSGADSRSRRSWNKSKRKLDESNYSLSATSGGSGLNSSTSANSNRAIKICFSIKARSILKRKMPVKHIEKHAADSEGHLNCHKQPIAREINRTDYNLMLINIKQIYSILAIALNLIGDDIQLCDLVRFINEGHIGTSNVLQYFPENIANNGKEMLKKINFYKCPEKYSDKAIKNNIGILCKYIGIRNFNNPDIVKLVQRYTKELGLPTEISCYIERLINLLPPNFNARVVGYYPGYEARAMAYIIFALKLLFGLDGSKEHRISRASKTLNAKIEQLNRRGNEKQSLLFVWDEWVEYIEMRKIIVSQFNTSFCEQFKEHQNINLVLEQMAEKMRQTDERNKLFNDQSENINFEDKLNSFKTFLERFQETYKVPEKDNKPPILIDFKPTLTPALSYLKTIFLLYNNRDSRNTSINVEIPDFMHIDHANRDINSYLQVKPLKEYFKNHQLNLKIHVIAANKDKKQIGIFRAPGGCKKKPTLYKACFEITEEEWDETVRANAAQNTDDLEFGNDFKTYTSGRKEPSQQKIFFNPLMSYKLNMKRNDEDDAEGNKRIPTENVTITDSKNNEAKQDLQSMHSFELFSENNMEPIDEENFITEPRRNLENIDIFEEISDEKSVLNDDDEDEDVNKSDNSEPVIFNGNESASITEEFIKIEPDSPNTAGFQTPNKKQDKSSETNKDLKLYISNMDCWMLLGIILKTTNAQKSQLQDKFPRSFNWLLEMCAHTIGVDWPVVYEQLLCIETMFCLGINDPKTIKNCVYIKSHNKCKEIQKIISTYREIW